MRHAEVIPVPPACRQRFSDSAPSRRHQISGTARWPVLEHLTIPNATPKQNQPNITIAARYADFQILPVKNP
jgi:hypothetical protein